MASRLLKIFLLFPTLLWAQIFTPGQTLKTKVVDNIAGQTLFDAFSRLEIASPYALGDYIHRFDLSPLLFDTTLVGAGSITHLPNQSSVRLRTTAASGDSVVFQSRRHHRYQAGRAGLITMTCVPGAGIANVVKRWGFFDEKNGLFFQLSGTTFSVVQRSFASGATVDSVITQTNFNGDKVNGTGRSGMNLSFTKANIFEIYFQWLGAGFASFRTIDSLGNVIELHRFRNGNRYSTVYMGTASLPIRYQQKTVGAASQSDLIAICSNVTSSGGEDPPEYEFGFGSTAVITTSTANETFVIAYRPDSLFNSQVNRALFLPKEFLFASDLSSCLFRVYYNGSVTSTGWTDVSTGFSGMEYTTSASAFTAGKPLIYQPVIASGPVTVAKSFSAASGVRKLALTRSATNKTYDNIIITVTRLTATNVDAMASMEWGELR